MADRDPVWSASAASSVFQTSYYTVSVNGKVNPNPAQQYRTSAPAAREIADRVAFLHGVRVVRAHQPSPAEPRNGGRLRRLLGRGR